MPDRKPGPFGPEWYLALRPHLQRQGGQMRTLYGVPYLRFALPKYGEVELLIRRISAIKVRKYGSHYRLDNHVQFRERWAALAMDKHLSNLWKPSSLADTTVRLRCIVFIGFGREAEPFGREIAALQKSLPWEPHQVVYRTRCWLDRYERGFSVRLAIWARQRDV
jgi:hypothetical protein